MANPIIYEFDPSVYPRKMWVAVTKDVEYLKNHFYFEDDVSGFENQFNAVVFSAVEVKTFNNGVFVLFSSKKHMTVETIAHESVHVTTMIFRDCAMKFSFENGLDEHFAYMVGWAANCMNKIKTGKVQKNNILEEK